MTPVGGGVTIHPRKDALQSNNLLADEDGKVTEAPRVDRA